jgi:hypothetical protein
MPSGQAFIDLLAQFIRFDDTLPRPLTVVMIPGLRPLIAAEQARLAATGATERTDTGDMTVRPGAGGVPQRIPTIVKLGADGGAAGGNGHPASIDEPGLSGRILIAAGGNATPAVSATTSGGDAECMGGGENLIIALGGNGVTPNSPARMPYGANGTNGGRGGHAIATARRDGCVAFAWGGDGAWGSRAQVGHPRRRNWIPWRPDGPPGPPGTDGDGGDGGDAVIIAKNHSTLDATAGRHGGGDRPSLAVYFTTPGQWGRDGRGLIYHGQIDVQARAINGSGSPGQIVTF